MTEFNKKMPRPKRQRTVKLTLSDDEFHLISSSAKKTPVSKYIRDFLLEHLMTDSQRFTPEIQKKADKSLLVEVARIGNNINQIARQLNTIDDPLERAKYFAYIQYISSQLDELVRYFTSKKNAD